MEQFNSAESTVLLLAFGLSLTLLNSRVLLLPRWIVVVEGGINGESDDGCDVVTCGGGVMYLEEGLKGDLDGGC